MYIYMYMVVSNLYPPLYVVLEAPPQIVSVDRWQLVDMQ